MSSNSYGWDLDALERFATSFRADFRFAPINIMLVLTVCFLGLVAYLSLYEFELQVVLTMGVAALALAVWLRLLQVWETSLVLTAAAALTAYLLHRPNSAILVSSILVAGLLGPCLQMAYQWERAVVLRFGSFRGLKGSGLFFVLPIIDKVSNFVDQRIRVTDFKAETTLTKDTVPVNVDAIAFWMVWDAKKAVLEVSDFNQAVILSAQTALRDAIGKHELGDMLSNRDRLGAGQP